MGRLNWDETDVVGVLEAIPVVEDYEVSHSFNFVRGNKKVSLLICQLESFVELKIFDEQSGNLFLNIAFYCRDECVVDSQECLISFSDCVFVENRFTYIENSDVFKREKTPYGNTVIICAREDDFSIKIV